MQPQRRRDSDASSGSGSRPPPPIQISRSRSPVVKSLEPGLATFSSRRPASPNVPIRRIHIQPTNYRYLLPSTFAITLPGTRHVRKITGDFRKAGENIILLVSLLLGMHQIWKDSEMENGWIVLELGTLIVLSVNYLIWTYLSYFSLPKALPPLRSPRMSSTAHRYRSSSPRVEIREARKWASLHPQPLPPTKDDFGYVWMTVPKNYRNSTDDGVLSALLIGPIISTACLHLSSRLLVSLPADGNPLPSSWLIEPPRSLGGYSALPHPTPLESLVLARRALVQLSTLCSAMLLVHLTASRWFEAHHRARHNVPEGERASVPRSEWRRNKLYIIFGLAVSAGMLAARFAFALTGLAVWKDLSYIDVASVSIFYQFTLYMAIRLAHHSFTLGELGFATFGACILFMEALHLTIARIWPITTPYIKTVRAPTPLLVFQLALIPGSILVGFLLSPLLYLSRHMAQRPLHRLRRNPEEKQIHRRFLALGFYGFAALIIGGLLGMWTRWCLGNRDPWLWVIFWLVEGRKKWTRPLLLAYWAALACVSVAGWSRQLSRSRRFRNRSSAPPLNGLATPDAAPPNPVSENPPSLAEAAGVMSSPNSHVLSLPALSNGVNVSSVANEFFDAADRRLPTLGINARRKFFHALAVIMFLPGIAVDPAFTHLSFSVAFAFFTFAEYIRYFALYPFGATIHVFLTEFLDDKDNGTAILSHFYLLTGCAGSVWLEGPSSLLAYTGVLVLGIGDAMASIVGRRIGRHRWSPTSSKTLEGSAAFAVSVVACAWLLRLCGLAEQFTTLRYAAVVCVTAVLEALSVQNDNLTLPWYMWSILVLTDSQ